MFRRQLCMGAVVTMVALVTVPVAPAVAATATVGCGSTITTSTTLAADVGPCPGDGIVIGADNITLNLAGHTISGAADHSDHPGVHLIGRSGVTVKGGKVTRFATGVAIEGGARNTVSNMTIQDNIGALDQSGTFGDGVGIFNSASNVVTGNIVRHNGPFEGIGVFGNGVPTLCEQPPFDPFFGPLSPADLRLLCRALGVGRNINPTQGNRIENNVVADNNIMHTLGGPTLLITEEIGINLGLGLQGGSHTTVRNNLVTGNGLDGIAACSIKGNPCFSDFNVIQANNVLSNGYTNLRSNVLVEFGQGVIVNDIVEDVNDFGHQDFQLPTHDDISGNNILRNASTGIFIANPGNTIQSNVADHNGAADARNTAPADLELNVSVPGQGACDSGNTIRQNIFGRVVVLPPLTPSCVVAAGNQVLTPGRSSAATGSTSAVNSSSELLVTPQRHAPA